MRTTLNQFKNQIFLGTIIVGLFCEVISLFFLGWNPNFAYGLLLGTAISIVNFNVMEFYLHKTLINSNRWMFFLGYMNRLLIFGVSFYVAIKVGILSGIGAIIGFMTLKIAIFYIHGIRAKFSTGRIVREEPEEVQPKKHWYDDQE